MNDKPEPGDRVAYFGRVSTPKQKLEHHWEPVQRWAASNGIDIPEHMKFEDKIRRHESASFFRDWDKREKNISRRRYRFDDLMSLIKGGQLDWIVISNFDRWGIRDKDEIFVFRSTLREYDVGLYAVVDDLNITGLDDSSFWRTAAAAEGATKYVSQQAEKNIAKMISMAEAGWATTGNAPYGLDLVLYSLSDLSRPIWRVVRTRYNRPHEYKVVYYKDTSRVERNEKGVITKSRLHVEREVIQNTMPPRDKKLTGYRYEPSVDTRRLDAVRLMFEMFNSDMSFGAISESLHRQGHNHYDHPFGYHGVETILRNPAYTGFVAWGKNGVGEYRIALDKKPTPIKRKKDETLTIKKDEAQYVYPLNPLFPAVVTPEQFANVKKKLDARPHKNESFGKKRTRDKASHPLNGKLFCPDCDTPMVLGSFTPGALTKKKTNGKAKATRCFVCGTYRKTIRTKCHANTVSWANLDAATDELLRTVAERIDAVKTGNLDALQEAEWLKKTELGRTILNVVYAVMGKGQFAPGPSAVHGYLAQKLELETRAAKHKLKPNDAILDTDASNVFKWAFDAYDAEHNAAAEGLRQELETINEELDAISEEIVLQRRKNASLAERLDKRAVALDARKREIEPQLVPMTERARAIMEQLDAIRQTITQADKLRVAQLLDSFVEKVYPVFEVQTTKSKTKPRRTQVVGFRYIPKSTAKQVLAEEMKVSSSRTASTVFHFVASLLVEEIRFREATPEDTIQELRSQGLSLDAIAKRTSSTPAIVRRIVGPLNKEEEAVKRRKHEELAKTINAQKITFNEKAKRFEVETGLGMTTFWRLTRK